MSIFKRLLAPFRRRSLDRDMTDEMRFHVEMEADELVRRGVSPDAARRQALARFGGVTRYREEGHSTRGSDWLVDLVQDIRYTKRALGHHRGYAAVAILTLALGIGATTTIFGVVNTVLLKPMPYRSPDKLFLLWDDLTWIGVPEAWATGPEIVRLRQTVKSFEGFAAVRGSSMGMTSQGGEPEQLSMIVATAEFFDLLGIQPALGRGFARGDDRTGAPMIAVISDGLWRRRFGADPATVGKVVALDGMPTTIVGILPPGGNFTLQSSLGAPSNVDMYVPLQDDLAAGPVNGHRYGVLARVRDDVPTPRAMAELNAVSKRVDAEIYRNQGFRFVPVSVHERLVRDVRPALIALMAAVGLLVLIMSANLATLALSRMARREREFAIRKALGASRARVSRQVLTETILVALVGAAGGVVLAHWGLRGLLALAPQGLPRRAEVGIDLRVVAFTLFVGLFVGVAMGLAPVVHSMRRDLAAMMREKVPVYGAAGTRSALVLGQIALSLVLLSGTALLLNSFMRLLRVDPGFDPTGVVAVSFRANPARYATPDRVATFIDAYVDRLRVLPGVRSVGVTTTPPLSAGADQYNVAFRDSPTNKGNNNDALLIDFAIAGPGYFTAAGISLLRGRDFSPQDNATSLPVVVIDEPLERRYFPGGSAIGRTIQIFGDTAATVIGVVKQPRLYSMQEEGRPQVYRAQAQTPARSVTVMVRGSASDVSSIAQAARSTLTQLDPAQPIISLQPFADVVAQSLGERRLVLVLVAGFAATALLLAALGVYGVTSTSVAQRTRELGIRMALGAQASEVVALVLRRPLQLVAAGLIAGAAGTVAARGLLAKLLYDVSPTDPVTLAAVAVTLAVVAALAGYFPAKRASRLDPAAVLRAE
jgi:putative ABC transport system permease protein